MPNQITYSEIYFGHFVSFFVYLFGPHSQKKLNLLNNRTYFRTKNVPIVTFVKHLVRGWTKQCMHLEMFAYLSTGENFMGIAGARFLAFLDDSIASQKLSVCVSVC